MTINVLFVCLGNICRSPTAHGVFEKLVADQQFSTRIFTDSAGTSNWHIGGSPDPRSTAVAAQRGYDLTQLQARQVSAEDFSHFHYVLAMDNDNLNHLQALQPNDYNGTLSLFLDFSRSEMREVPDPYYGGTDGFETVLDLIEQASQGLLADIKAKHL